MAHMAGLDDFQYQAPDQAPEASDPPPAAPTRSRLVPAAAAGIVLVVLLAGAYFLSQPRAPVDTSAPAPEAATEAPVPSDAVPVTEAPAYVLPPLADSDAFMRERVRELSAHAIAATWARGSGLAANVAVVLENTSRGLSPSRHLARLRPAGSFRVLERGNRVVLDPRNYQRFVPIAEAVASVDPAAAARIYTGIKPLLQMAYDELGNQEPIDQALERAVRQVLAAPVIEGEVPLRVGGAGIGFAFANPSLESLPAAQKQLIRMGPANQRLIQSNIRRFAEAAGITVQ